MESLLATTLAETPIDITYGVPRYDYDIVDSTLDVARDLALGGAPDGTLVTAQHQRAGRGRRQAQWVDQPGESALLTYVVRPTSKTLLSEPWRIPFMASLAAVMASHDLSLADARVKWPNDLYHGNRKLGGLIVETVDRQSDSACYLLGIGINVSQTSFPDAEHFIQPPTSFAIELENRESFDTVPSVERVTNAVSTRLGEIISMYGDDPDSLMTEWRKRQMTGQFQRGISLDGTRDVSGQYLDVRQWDGAGLIQVNAQDGVKAQVTAILPARA